MLRKSPIRPGNASIDRSVGSIVALSSAAGVAVDEHMHAGARQNINALGGRPQEPRIRVSAR